MFAALRLTRHNGEHHLRLGSYEQPPNGATLAVRVGIRLTISCSRLTDLIKISVSSAFGRSLEGRPKSTPH